jgi:hypothetical protein
MPPCAKAVEVVNAVNAMTTRIARVLVLSIDISRNMVDRGRKTG